MKSSMNLDLSDNFDDSSLHRNHHTSTKLTTTMPTLANSNRNNGTNEINTKSRFGHKSKNMFFVRHAAIPQNLRIITGAFVSIVFYSLLTIPQIKTRSDANIKFLKKFNI